MRARQESWNVIDERWARGEARQGKDVREDAQKEEINVHHEPKLGDPTPIAHLEMDGDRLRPGVEQNHSVDENDHRQRLIEPPARGQKGNAG